MVVGSCPGRPTSTGRGSDRMMRPQPSYPMCPEEGTLSVSTRRRGVAYWFAVAVLKPALFLWTRHQWSGAEHLPRDRGFLVVANHLSYADPITLAEFLHDNGFSPRFVAKVGLFGLPGVGWLLSSARQIPVRRNSRVAGKALTEVVRAVENGDCVVIYPEATLTRDPGLWPMSGKTGAARVALETGCPVIPVAQWGPQELIPPYGGRPRLFRRTRIQVAAGPAMDLSAFLGQPSQMSQRREITDLFRDEVTALLEDLRQEKAPESHRRARTPGTGTDGPGTTGSEAAK
jgi:1-acyl-sn-glycerol-3-phosphate acyltransferase